MVQERIDNLKDAIRYCSGIGKCENCPQDFQCNGTSGSWYMLRLISDALDELEKRVEVVRCRDCEYTEKWHDSIYCQRLRDRWNHSYDRLVDEEDFCAWGKRKGGGRDDD